MPLGGSDRPPSVIDCGTPSGPAASPQTLGLPPEVDPVAHQLGAAALDLDGPAVRRLLADHLACTPVEATWENGLRPVLAAIGAGGRTWPTASQWST
jgi:hypothetical protein